MNSEQVQKQIDEDRAAMLLGITRAQLRTLREQSGTERGALREDSEQRPFTYHELYRICCCLARS